MKSLFKNVFSLGLVQGINLVVPLLLTPFLIKELGMSNYGIIALIQSITTFFFIVTDYGFNITTVRDISLNKENNETVSEIISNTIKTKFFLLLLCFPFFYLCSFFLLKTHYSFLAMLGGFTILMGQTFYPVWFFQGFEKQFYLSISNIFSKTLILYLVYTIVKVPDDFVWVNLIFGLSNFIFNLFFLIYGLIVFKINITLNLKDYDLLKQIGKGWYIFKGNIAISLYSNAGTIILAIIGANGETVGLFSVLDKITQILRIPINIYIQSTHSYFCFNANNTPISFFFEKYMLKPFLWFLFLSVFFTFFLYLFSDNIILYLFQKINNEIIISYRIVSVLPLSILIFNVIHYQLLIINNKDKILSNVIGICSIFGVVILFFFAYFWSIIGLSIAIVLIEMIVGISLTISFHKIYKSVYYGKLQNLWRRIHFY